MRAGQGDEGEGEGGRRRSGWGRYKMRMDSSVSPRGSDGENGEGEDRHRK